MSWHHKQVSGGKWKPYRKKILDRDNWTCAKCGDYGNEVDHITPISQGGDYWSLDNLQVLCSSCHIEKTRCERGELHGRAEYRRFIKDLTIKST